VTNKQLAAARKAMNQFPGLRAVKEGEIVTPSRDGVLGTPITITDIMSEGQVEAAIKASCKVLNA
jgi:hypothetical protein